MVLLACVAVCVSISSANAEEPQSDAILFRESFDDADLPQRGWYDGDKFKIVSEAAYAGRGCIEYRWNDEATVPHTSSGARHPLMATDELFIRYYIRLSEDWDWSGTSYHPHLTHFLTTENGKWHGPARSHLTLYIEPVNGKLRLGATDMENEDMPHGLTQGPLRGGYNGKLYDSENRLFTDGRWHCIEAQFRLNTINMENDTANADGVIRGWFDDELVIEHSDIIFRTTDFPDMKWNQFLLTPYFGPGLLPHAQTLWIDELVVSTKRVGSLSKPPASGNKAVIGSIDRLDPRLDAVVPSGAELEVLADGHEWTEGPVWAPALQAILYSDIPNNAIYQWSEGAAASVWLQPSGYTGDAPRGGELGSNGLLLDDEGHLVLAQHGDRRLARLIGPLDAPEPEFETLADRFEGKRFNSPNDVAMRRNGDLYFTDPPYGLEQGVDDPAKELDVQGVYRLATDGSVTLLVDDLSRPNGIAFSPDEDLLYVANSDGKQPVIMAYPVEPSGELGDGRVFFESWGDGLTVDQQGRLYVAGPGNGVMILSPEGEHLGSLNTTQRTSNCAFGEDGATLYITSDMYLLRIRLNVKGVGF
jgi:gluconolactonase